MLDKLSWENVPDTQARELAEKVLTGLKPKGYERAQFKAEAAALPFYETYRLYRLGGRDVKNNFPIPAECYALWDGKGTPFLIDGNSTPLHDANDEAPLVLTPENTADYIRFFMFGLLGAGDQFILLEPSHDSGISNMEVVAKYCHPLTYKGQDDIDRALYEAVISFKGNIFSTILAVSQKGMVEMLDDKPLVGAEAVQVVSSLPNLGGARVISEFLSRPVIQVVASCASESAFHILSELLLVSALERQSQNRLITYFNAIQAKENSLEQFAHLIVAAAPVVIVETQIPFIGEEIGEIIKGQVYGVHLVVNTATSDRLPSPPPALAVVPIQSNSTLAYASDIAPNDAAGMNACMERLAHNLATKDVAALITCESYGHVPENMRAITDIVLKLPAINADIFEELFERVIGSPAPDGWRQQGDAWSKYVLHTDFEHPRRMKMSPDKAFAYIRDQVKERVAAVDPVQGMGLNELHGLGEARQFAEDLIADIHAAIQGKIPWAQVDRGALLTGPPGTGKTTLARAIAKDCNVKFVQASAAAWQAAGYLHDHLTAIRKTFAEARRYAPSILFIDEIDSLGNREQFVGHNAQYNTEVVNAVLEQIQGIDANAPVFVLGATNHEDRVDPALKRSGRMDRVIQIPRPNSEALGQIFGHYLGKLESGQADPAIDPAALGRLSVGMTGADVERIVRGAARRARRVGGAISQMDIIAEITNKPRNAGSSPRLTPEELERTAYHEAGHAIAMCLSASQGADIGFVTIVPRDGALGFVKPNDDERISYTRKDYEERIEIYLAGRVAEAIRYGEENVSSGATTDLKAATYLAISMVTKLGFGRSRKLLWTETPGEEDLKQAEQIISQLYDRVRDKLLGSKAALTDLAEGLKARQELTGDEVRSIIHQGKGKG